MLTPASAWNRATVSSSQRVIPIAMSSPHHHNRSWEGGGAGWRARASGADENAVATGASAASFRKWRRARRCWVLGRPSIEVTAFSLGGWTRQILLSLLRGQLPSHTAARERQ